MRWKDTRGRENGWDGWNTEMGQGQRQSMQWGFLGTMRSAGTSGGGGRYALVLFSRDPESSWSGHEAATETSHLSGSVVPRALCMV